MTSGQVPDDIWMIEKSISLIKNDVHAAKSWLLTARTLFPRNFQIQYQAYKLEKMQKNPKKVAVLLEEMLINFPQERTLWEEVHQVIDLLQTDTQDEKSHFLKEVFDGLPPQLQCHVLLKVADTQTDVLQRCRLVMLVLQRYPQRVADHGMKLIDDLLTAEKQHMMQSPINCYKKYLVCDVLPVVLKAPLPESTHPVLLRCLEHSLQFYITYITQPPSVDRLTSPTGVSTPGGAAVVSRRTSIQGLAEKDCYINNPWQCAINTLKLTSQQLGWNLHNVFAQDNEEMIWQQVFSLYDQRTQTDGLSQVFYACVVLCFNCLLSYTSKVEPDAFTGLNPGSSSTQALVLVEGFRPPHNGSPEHKKKKSEVSAPQFTWSPSVVAAKDVIQHFQVATRCWQLLHTNDKLLAETERLLGQWQTDSWTWLHSFQVDYALYLGQFKEAVTILHKLMCVPAQSPGNTQFQLRIELQMASCYHSMKNLSKCFEAVLRLVQGVPEHGEVTGPAPLVHTSGSGRMLQLMVCDGPHVFSYLVHLLITSLREKAWTTFQGGDVFLGHMIVLLQFDWPRYEELFNEVTERIKKRGNFTYNLFFNYIINIDILEEFAFLRSQEGGKVNLDILSISAKALAQSRAVTRGVNKVVKEDFKSALEKQVSRCGENVELLIRSFLVEEMETLQTSLL